MSVARISATTTTRCSRSTPTALAILRVGGTLTAIVYPLNAGPEFQNITGLALQHSTDFLQS